MDFLSEKNIYHGDLAARNILLNEHLVAKVADFGLSRRLYEDFSMNSLFKENTTSMRLPTKWLALEALTHGQILPGKSDVWSFGVVMWELFSMGLEPYRKRNYNISILVYDGFLSETGRKGYLEFKNIILIIFRY